MIPVNEGIRNNTIDVNKKIELKKTIKKIMKNNSDIVEQYRSGKKGFIGLIMKKVIEESMSSFHSKSSRQKLMNEIKILLK